MRSLAEQILAEARTLPEGSPLTAKALLHLGGRAAVDQALHRLAQAGQLMRVSRGVYVSPVETRFGARAPAVPKVVEAMARSLGEVVVPHGAAAANSLGLTTQVPVRQVYLTSGPSRRLKLGRQVVELRHVAPWQLVQPNTPAGDCVRALAWLGREHAPSAARSLKARLGTAALEALGGLRAGLPGWLAQTVSDSLVHA